MKKSLFAILLSLISLSLSAKDDIYIGLGPYFQTQPYKDADPVVLATPVIFFDDSFLYIRWTRLGMYLYGDKGDRFSWGLSLTAQPQVNGYYESEPWNGLTDREKTPILKGIDPSREGSWEGGLALSTRYDDYFGELLVMHDLLGENSATKIRMEVGVDYEVGDFYFAPSLLAIWYSRKFIDYYYGVDPEDVDLTIGRMTYDPDATLNLAAQTYVKYNIDEHWHLLANLRVDYLGRNIRQSPLVDKTLMYSGMLSVMYSFDLFGQNKAVLNIPEKK